MEEGKVSITVMPELSTLPAETYHARVEPLRSGSNAIGQNLCAVKWIQAVNEHLAFVSTGLHRSLPLEKDQKRMFVLIRHLHHLL